MSLFCKKKIDNLKNQVYNLIKGREEIDMYTFLNKENARVFNKNEMAKVIGLHPDTMRKIINGKIKCSKVIAYCITKFINEDAEIKDYFEIEGE